MRAYFSSQGNDIKKIDMCYFILFYFCALAFGNNGFHKKINVVF
jgi:hypothetical protein